MKEQLKQIKSILTNLLVRGGIVVGFLYFPTQKIFLNYITLLHWFFWIVASIMILAVLVIGQLKPTILEPDDKKVITIRKCKAAWGSWSRIVNTYAINIPSLLFIGIYMGDWSLFIPVFLMDVLTFLFFTMANSIWDNLPKNVTEDEANLKAIKALEKDPISKVLEDMKLKKSQEEKATDALADKLMEE